MAKYRKRPIVVEAMEWRGGDDHPAVDSALNHTVKDGWWCDCGVPRSEHGVIETREGPYIVCPGDWIITGVQGEHYPCKPETFKDTYDPIRAQE